MEIKYPFNVVLTLRKYITKLDFEVKGEITTGTMDNILEVPSCTEIVVLVILQYGIQWHQIQTFMRFRANTNSFVVISAYFQQLRVNISVYRTCVMG